MQDTGTGRKRKRKIKSEDGEVIEEENVITVSEFMTVQDLANLMDVPASEIIKKCLDLGQMVTLNQRLDMDMIKLLAEDYHLKYRKKRNLPPPIWKNILKKKTDPKITVRAIRW